MNDNIEHVEYRRGAYTLGTWSDDYCPFCLEEDRRVTHDHVRLVRRGFDPNALRGMAQFCRDVAGLVDPFTIDPAVRLPGADGPTWGTDDDWALETEVQRAEAALTDAGLQYWWEDGYLIERVIEHPKVAICTREWGGPKDGPKSEWWMFSSRHARRLKVRAVRRFRPEVNYFLSWNDADPDFPFGLELAHADWVPEGQVVFQ